MEISCYYYHGNVTSKAFAFIKEGDNIYVEIAYLTHKLSGLNLKRCDFVIQFEELKQYRKLSEYYQLSLILTDNSNQLTYNESGDFMGFESHKWCIPCKRNWKGVCFSDNYLCNFGFAKYPENPTKINDKNVNALKIKYYRDVFEKKEQKENMSYLQLYVETEMVKIAFALEAVESKVNMDKNLMDKVYALDSLLPNDLLTKILIILQ